MMPAEKTTKMSENRRSNKPIMEKRRRARINGCLNDLKLLILEALKKDPARHSKLEKADILEMTVKHLQSLHVQHMALSAAADQNIANKFRAGFKECATEVTRFLSRTGGVDMNVRERLGNHLLNCVNAHTVDGDTGIYGHVTSSLANHVTMRINNCVPTVVGSVPTVNKQFTNRRAEEISNSANTNASSMVSPSSRMANNGSRMANNGSYLYPTRLSNRELAVLLPGNYSMGSYSNATQGNFLPTNGTMNQMGKMNDPSLAVPRVSPIPSHSPQSLPLNHQSPLPPLHFGYQDCGNAYGGSPRSTFDHEVQEREVRHGPNQTGYFSTEQQKVKEECQEITCLEVSCKDSLIKKDPWRPW